MADALASGASEGYLVGVQVPPRPPRNPCSAGVSSRPETPTSTELLPLRAQGCEILFVVAHVGGDADAYAPVEIDSHTNNGVLDDRD